MRNSGDFVEFLAGKCAASLGDANFDKIDELEVAATKGPRLNGSDDPLFFQVTCYSFVDGDVGGGEGIPERGELLRQWKLFGVAHNANVFEEAHDIGAVAAPSPSIAEKSNEPHRSLRSVGSGLYVDYFRLALKVGKHMLMLADCT